MISRGNSKWSQRKGDPVIATCHIRVALRTMLKVLFVSAFFLPMLLQFQTLFFRLNESGYPLIAHLSDRSCGCVQSRYCKDVPSCNFHRQLDSHENSSAEFVLADSSFYNGNTHRGGWKSVITFLLGSSRILETRNEGENGKPMLSIEGDKVLLIDMTESWFKRVQKDAISVPWIGISHLVHNAPSHWPQKQSLGNLLQDSMFLQSLPNCRGLVVLAGDEADIAKQVLKNSSAPVCLIPHPIGVEETAVPYDPVVDLSATFSDGHGVVLVGQQYRRLATIHKLRTSGRPKFWLPGRELSRQMNSRMRKDLEVQGVEWDNAVEIKYMSSFDEYDRFIKQNIVVIDLWAATANNAVLEAIALNCPFFVRRLPSTVEYLGGNYPLLFSTFDELQGMLSRNESELQELMMDGHRYLERMNKSRLSLQSFSDELQECASRGAPKRRD